MDGKNLSSDENLSHVAHSEGDQFICKLCNNAYSTDKSLLIHIRQHTTPATNTCQTCAKTFDKVRALHTHIKRHTSIRKFQCEFCFATFKASRDLKVHILCHSEPDKVGFKCTACNKSFLRKDLLIRHMKLHTPEGQERVLCKVCGASVRKQIYSTHLRRHFATKRYSCSVCEKLFASLSKLTSHFNIHTGDVLYNCDLCSFHCTFKEQLKTHMRKHVQDKPYKCSKCQKRYKRPENLNRHFKLHANSRPYRCLKCERTFTTLYALKYHEQTHSIIEKKHQCDQCQRSFITQLRLKAHKRCHNRPYVCGVCNHSFGWSVYLSRHMTVHREGNICKICNKSYHSLGKHMLKHKRQTVYECHECNVVYSNLKTYKGACKHVQIKMPRCQLCSRIFITEHGLNLHIKRYQNLEMECFSSAKAKAERKKEEKEIKPKPKQKCHECNREFKDTHSYRHHMESHDPNKQFCCEYCHERFYSFTRLYKHLGKHNG